MAGHDRVLGRGRGAGDPLAADGRAARRAGRPAAIVYDIMAVAGLSVVAEMGLSVPGDVSLLAWDDSQLCRLTRPTLSARGRGPTPWPRRCSLRVARRLLPRCDLRRLDRRDCAATLLISSMGLSARSACATQQCRSRTSGGEPSCLVPSGTSSSSTASAPRSARRARRASTTRPVPTTSS
ncbi:substrate-binding domain-containing protein [Streptomyces sp. NPDC057616]|uniref:substrate-binding domain-containing protein n=1 Tax=Streptomyces sp. NPDC057616 TaxID=3346183 RepID=UPI0036B1C904